MAKERKIDKSGSGLINTMVDIDNKKFTIDFSGKEIKEYYNPITGEKQLVEHCYFNSESVLFFVSNSYFLAYRAIYKDLLLYIRKYKKDKSHQNYKLILRHILPYYYNFRHFIETQLKAFAICVKRESFLEGHNLVFLLDDVIDGVAALSLKFNNMKRKKEELQQEKEVILLDLEKLKALILKYLEIEPSHEYYRYIFTRDFKCENPVVTLDLKSTEKLFRKILKLFRDIEKNLSFTREFYHLV